MVSFVVIGYNESRHLADCLRSVRDADMDGLTYELIYVDGGSTDYSMTLARTVGVDQLLGGDRRRRAAENRNLGLAAANGAYVQFLDGDMTLDPTWPARALRLLDARPDVVAVAGRLDERNPAAIYRAMQLDWRQPEGEVPYCGGAAMFRTAALRQAGGFPEHVAYGEEPLLCWRLRNDYRGKVYHLPERMVGHDLAFRGFGDYWRRNVRVGETYAEIAALCRHTADPFWSREVRNNVIWFFGLMIIAMVALAGPLYVRWVLFGAIMLILTRKTLQKRREGIAVAVVYALHTYLAKLGIGWGILRWSRSRRKR